jgi:hypothetical protein
LDSGIEWYAICCQKVLGAAAWMTPQMAVPRQVTCGEPAVSSDPDAQSPTAPWSLRSRGLVDRCQECFGAAGEQVGPALDGQRTGLLSRD